MNKKMMLVVGIIAVVIVIAVVVITMNLGGNNVKINLDTARENVTNLKTEAYDYKKAGNEIVAKSTEKGIMDGEPEFIYDFDLEKYGIDSAKLSSDNGMVDFLMFKTEKESLMIFKAAEGQKEALIKEVDAFYKDANVLKDEVKGYTVYLNTKNNDEALKIIKEDGYETIYNSLNTITDETLNLVGLNKEDVEEYVITTPAFIISSQCYMIVKPAQGKEDKVKEALDNYFKTEENKWSTYLPAEYEIIKNRKFEKIGDYLVYVVSTDNDKVLETIKESK